MCNESETPERTNTVISLKKLIFAVKQKVLSLVNFTLNFVHPFRTTMERKAEINRFTMLLASSLKYVVFVCMCSKSKRDNI